MIELKSKFNHKINYIKKIHKLLNNQMNFKLNTKFMKNYVMNIFKVIKSIKMVN